MTEVIRRVVDETRRECESLFRSWVFNKNGAAGCFIIKQEFILAADCYRDILRSTESFERRYGILTDYSQRLHAITNLHWLFETHRVPKLDEAVSWPKHHQSDNTNHALKSSLVVVEEYFFDGLDSRIDFDLLAKTERLRNAYIKMHSHLLAKIHDNLDSVSTELDQGLSAVNDKAETDNLTDWLTWLSEAIDWLISCGVGANLVDMLVASFRGTSNMGFNKFRTSLLYAKSIANFKTMLLAEMADLFAAREKLRDVMHPLIDTWHSFKNGQEVNKHVLQKFYACCSRTSTSNEAPDSVDKSQPKKSKKSDAKAIKSQCAYCIAVRALIDYQRALNHERLKVANPDRWHLEYDELAATGLVQNNPLVVAISIVSQQICKLSTLKSGRANNKLIAKRLEQLLRLMGKESLLISQTQSLTKEWWNIHDDTEQFVIRLQSTSPSDLAFIHDEEVDVQLQSYIVEAQTLWSRLQSRLGHFNFLRNAQLNAVTSQDSDSKTKSQPLECPTCLQLHSPAKPTFVLLPGCWHMLCVACHDRIASLGQPAQRRCPICRTPFESRENVNARRRRPFTLIHFSGNDQQIAAKDNGLDKELTHQLEDEIEVIGDHSTKVRSVIQCLKQIKLHDPDAKAIVFSSWLSVLVTLAGAFEQNGLPYTTLFKARDACQPGRLSSFQCMGSFRWILLMPIQLGANGLNLTAANHILFVDPVLSPGRESQAIARIHRIGQTRPGVFHRFLVRDSIEAALYQTHIKALKLGTFNMETECMIGARTRRSGSKCLGDASPNEDKDYLKQMKVGQLSELLHFECNSHMLQEEMITPSFNCED